MPRRTLRLTFPSRGSFSFQQFLPDPCPHALQGAGILISPLDFADTEGAERCQFTTDGDATAGAMGDSCVNHEKTSTEASARTARVGYTNVS